MISAIEQLDNKSHDNNVENSDEAAEDPNSLYIPGNKQSEEKQLLEKLGLFKAMPLYEKVLAAYLMVFIDTHPIVTQTKFAMAECYKSIGQYDQAYVLFNETMAQRRTLYGDNHFEVVSSMLAVGDILKCLLRIFPESASGNLDSKQIRQAKNAIPVGVSLSQTFNSIIRPQTSFQTLKQQFNSQTTSEVVEYPDDQSVAENGSSAHKKRPKRSNLRDPNWVFLSEPEGQVKRKKEVIKLTKGYMGYQFPSGECVCVMFCLYC
jgi:hypothetical protein